MASLPATIRALRVQEDKSDLELVEIPLASRSDVIDLNPDHILVRVRAVGLNPTDWKVGDSRDPVISTQEFP